MSNPYVIPVHFKAFRHINLNNNLPHLGTSPRGDSKMGHIPSKVKPHSNFPGRGLCGHPPREHAGMLWFSVSWLQNRTSRVRILPLLPLAQRISIYHVLSALPAKIDMAELRASPNGHVATGKGATLQNKGVTIGLVLSDYLDWQDIYGYTADTQRSYRTNIGDFIKYLKSVNHSLGVLDITLRDCRSYMANLKRLRRSPQTIASRFKSLKTFLSWCVSENLLPANPLINEKPPKVPKVRKRFLPEGAFEKLLSVCPASTFTGSRRRAMLWLFATSGMRKKELWRLSLDDLDMKGAKIHVFGKGQKDRWVAFHDEARKAMWKYLTLRRERDRGYRELWLTEEGVPLSFWGVGQDMERVAKRAGVRSDIQDICHVYRRTLAAKALRSGMPPAYVRMNLGWADDSMLSKYTRWMEEEESEALDAFRGLDVF